MKRFLGIVIGLVLLAALVGCPSQVTSVQVSIDPTTVTLAPGATQTFTATVTGSSDNSVIWSHTCGTLNGSGTSVDYTAPATASTCSITVTSAADTNANASATVTVKAAAPTIGQFYASPSPATASQQMSFQWAITGGTAPLSCSLDPGDGSSPLSIGDCSKTTSAAYTYTAAGTFTATLSIVGQGVTKTAGVVVQKASTSPPKLFASPVSYDVECCGANYNLVAADINADDHLDLVVSSDVGIYALYGKANGTFSNARTLSYQDGGEGVQVADFNSDGALDIAVDDPSTNSVAMLLNYGSGTFMPAKSYPAGGFPTGMYAADLNNDNVLDLAVANKSADTVSVLQGNGDGSFKGPVALSVGSGPVSVVSADVNGDNIPDLIVANSTSDNVSVLLGQGGGTFKGAVEYATGPNSAPRSVAVRDVNHDGALDIITANSGADNISVLLGNGNGTFKPYRTYPTSAYSAYEVVGDFNGDGNLDVVTTNSAKCTVSVLLGNGDGSFQAATPYVAGCYSGGIVDGDFNKDGKLDLALLANGSVNVLLAN